MGASRARNCLELLTERRNGIQEVDSSILFTSTTEASET